MTSYLYWSVDGLPHEIGPFVGITDVVAATYNIILLLKKAEEVYIVRDNKAAFGALEKFPQAVLMGESTEPGLPFVVSNSPVKIMKLNLHGKTAILKTNNGTAVVAEAFDRGAQVVFGFHWANLETTGKWVHRQKPKTMTLVASGGREDVFTAVGGKLLEDWYCCKALQELLDGKRPDYREYFSLTRKSILEQYPPGDPHKETLDMLLRKEKDFGGIVPVFSVVGEGIYRVTNAAFSRV